MKTIKRNSPSIAVVGKATRVLALQDLKGMTQVAIKKHLIENYSGESGRGGYGLGIERSKAKKLLKDKQVLIAYESVGDWGCDSSSFFVLRDRVTGKYYELHGSHCSCYGFEGQLKDLEETTIDALKKRADDGHLFCAGGYDNDSAFNEWKTKNLLMNL